MSWERARRDTLQSLAEGLSIRPCECPAHLIGRCYITSCCCLRHRGLGCNGMVRVDICAECGASVLLGEFLVLECACIHCEDCAVGTLLSKPWAQDKPTDTLLAMVRGFMYDASQEERLRRRVEEARR